MNQDSTIDSESKTDRANQAWQQGSSVGIKSPGFYPSPFIVADTGIFAILGHDLGLLQLYKLGPESTKCIHGDYSMLSQSIKPRKIKQDLLWQGQKSLRRVFDWGLRVKVDGKAVGPGSKHKNGFIDLKWPFQMLQTGNTPGREIHQRATTYIQDGRLVQAIAIFCNYASNYSWEIGGEVQMRSDNTTPSGIFYTVNVSKLQSRSEGGEETPVLTIGGKFKDGKEGIVDQTYMDVAVFQNGKPQNIDHDENLAANQSINFKFDSIFSLRDGSQKLEAETMSCPHSSEISYHLGIQSSKDNIPASGPSLPSLSDALIGKTGIYQLDGMSDIITRIFEQLCSMAVPFPSQLSQKIGMHDKRTKDQSPVFILNNPVIDDLEGLASKIQTNFWHVRLLAQVHTILEPESQKQQRSRDAGLAEQIKNIISGCISTSLSLFYGQKTAESDIAPQKAKAEAQAYFSMSLLLANNCIDLESLPETNMKSSILPIRIENHPGEEKLKATFRLLQWSHRQILVDERFKKLFSEKFWLKHYLDNNEKVLEEELKHYGDEALRSLPMLSGIDILSENDDFENIFSQLAEEERWIRMALLQVEIFAENENLRPFLLDLVDQVGKRLKRRATRSIGNLPPWGYQCLDHVLEMDLIVAKKKLEFSQENLQDRIQSSYGNCCYYLKSDFYFLRSRDTADPRWIEGHWDMGLSSSICSSFLNAVDVLQRNTDSKKIVAANPSTLGKVYAHKISSVKERSTDMLEYLDLETMSLIASTLEATREILHPLQKSSEFPWKQTLRNRVPYPNFMCTSLRIRDGVQDRKNLDERMIALKNQDKRNPLVSDTSKAFIDLVNNIPDAWTKDDLDILDEEVRIVDFPWRKYYDSRAEVLNLLLENRLDCDATYRIIAVNTLGRPRLLNTYLHFAHEDAWDAIVDNFGSMSLFRGSTDSFGDETDEPSWRMSLNIAHIILEPRTDASVSDQPSNVWKPPRHEIPVEYDKDKRAFRNVCSTICMTGDRAGDFWTSSLLEPFSTLETNRNKPAQLSAQNDSTALGKDGEHEPPVIFDDEKIAKVLDWYKFDKYSARNLVFVVQITRLIWVLAGMSVKDYTSRLRLLCLPDLVRKADDITNTLRRVLWGIEWLQKLEWSIKSADVAINEAISYAEKNVSKRRQYWHPKLGDFEQEQVQGENRRALSRIKACQNKIETISRRATNIKKNLISLTNMTSTEAILSTTVDTSRMKHISILTKQ